MRKKDQHQISLFESSMQDIAPPAAEIPHKSAAPHETKAPEATPKSARPSGGPKPHARTSALDITYRNLMKGLRDFFAARKMKRGVLGLSGGVDSSLTLKIAVDALGSENVAAILMPELGLTKQENVDHAKLLCQFFDVRCLYQPINAHIMDFGIVPWKPSDHAKSNTKARIRAVMLYSFANTENALVLGTSNKSELLLGYGTKFGDLAADVEVIGDLLKTEVVALADHAGLPLEIVNKTPSAELSLGQTDEAELGAAYQDIDKVLAKLDLGRAGCMEHGHSAPLVNLVFRRVEENAHKRELPVVIQA